MLTKLVRRMVCLLGLLALAATPGLFAQNPYPGMQGGMGQGGSMRAPGRGAMMGRMMGPERIAPIANAPFTATATLTSSRGQQIFQLARDTQGRTYVETTEPMRRFRGSNGNAGSSGEQQVIRVTDPVAGVSYTIFPARKLILEGKLRPPRGRNTGNRRGPNREAATRSLGEQKIAGTAANGVETTTNLPARGDRPAVTLTREVWTADALHLVLKESSSGFQGRRSSYVVTSLSTNPPDPSLFTPPSGYKVRHMRGFRG